MEPNYLHLISFFFGEVTGEYEPLLFAFKMSHPKDIRLHIGNISAQLHDDPSRLENRLSKFGTIKEGLSFHTKPLGDHYFAYVTMNTTEAQVEKLKKAFNGVVFMGKKLSLGVAKPSAYSPGDFAKEVPNKKQMQKEHGVQQARQDRIDESRALQRLNSVTESIITPHYISSKLQSQGYSVSAHTFANISGNTKSGKVDKMLVGAKSYGAWTLPKPKQTNAQYYANLSGAGEVIKGRFRKTPRPKTHFLKRQQTLRILINGELKTIKFYKTKLWGIEKNKTALELTWRYANGEWKSGDDHIIERKRTRNFDNLCGISGSGAIEYGNSTHINEDEANDGSDREDDSVDEEINRESERNKSILATLFQSDTFDKPVDVEDNDNGIDKEDIIYDSKGRRKVIRHDLEMTQIVNGDEDEMDVDDEAKKLIDDYRNHASRPEAEIYYDESDEGNDLDLSELAKSYTTEAISDKYVEDHQEFEVVKEEPEIELKQDQESESDHDADFMPQFTQISHATNKTDTLRSIFNEAEGSSGFKLALSEDDEDVDVEKEQEALQAQAEQERLLAEIKQRQREEEEKMLLSSKLARYGLFWPHSDSPFLLTQSQLLKLGSTIKLPGESDLTTDISTVGDLAETAYEKWFWSQRGELSRECKRQKRDALRRRKGKSVTL